MSKETSVNNVKEMLLAGLKNLYQSQSELLSMHYEPRGPRQQKNMLIGLTSSRT